MVITRFLQRRASRDARPLRYLGFLVLVIVMAIFGAGQAEAAKPSQLVVVEKSKRALMFFEHGQLIKTYKVSLGQNPIGHKERQGDNRTPEGKYYLTWTNDRSKFYKSLHVTYPNDEDRKRAWSKGISPGGDIKIHGLPNKPVYGEDIYMSLNWTNGCIAMRNRDLDDLLSRVKYQTPIYIIP